MTSRSAVVRPRLVVVQVLLVALFGTLLGRLWFLQVASGESYRAQAVDNAVQDVVVQPQRGLIVDAQGRTLAASRSAWVVAVDRSDLAELDAATRRSVLRRLSNALGMRYRRVVARTKLCGEAGAPPAGICWNGSPYEPVTIMDDVPEQVAIGLQEQGEDYPAVVVEQRSVRSYPGPYGINAAHVLGYLTPITADELTQAEDDTDDTLNGGSLVGRSGLERSYDRYLRGVPGSTGVGVDSQGRTTGDEEAVAATPGNTVVTSIDARVQGVVEDELHKAIKTARTVRDPITGRNYEATSGSAVVLDPTDGSVVAMASYPTYNPGIWNGGVTAGQLRRLYSKRAGEPLLSRATQGQLAPGSTFKPFMTAGALANGFDTDTRLNCSSSLRVGNRDFKNFESGAHGYIGFDKALQLSCNTFFYRVAYELWQRAGGEDAGVKADVFLADAAKAFGFGSATGVDLPGEASGRIADPTWKQSYYESMKGYYCDLADSGKGSDYIDLFAREFCIEGYKYRAGDAVNFVIGQGDTTVTPLQLATAYGALANGGTLWEPRVAEAVISPDGELVRRVKPTSSGRVPYTRDSLRYIDNALKGTSRTGTYAWKLDGFPLDEVQLRSKTGTAEVQGKQTTGWLATYTEDYVVVMMIEQGGTGSGSSGDAVRAIWEALYGIEGSTVNPEKALVPGTTTPDTLPIFRKDGRIDPPRTPWRRR